MLTVLNHSPTPSLFARVATFVFDRLIQQPLAGIAHLVAGAAQTLLPLARATANAVIGTVRSYLTVEDEADVEQGIDSMRVGTALLAWPLALLGGLLLWRAPLVVQALFAVGTLGLVMG